MRKTGKFEQKLNDIDEKVHFAHEELSLMREILAVNTEQLRIHIEGVEQTRKLIDLKERQLAERLTPIEDHVKFINKLTKLLAWSVALPGSIYYVIQIARLF